MMKLVSLASLTVVLAVVASCAKADAEPAPPRDAPASKPEAPPPSADAAAVAPIDVVVTDIDGKPVDLKALRGKAVLVVNTASECGYTPQYAGLEKLHRAYKDKGLVVLAVPSNDFGAQEPGTNEQIKTFTHETFDVTFALMDKVHATGAEQSPLFAYLTTAGPPETRGDVRWNFTKFLLDVDGRLVARFDSKIDPMSAEVTSAVERALPKT